MFDILDEDSFTFYAIKAYQNPNCTDILEFHDDLNRIKYLKKLFRKYHETKDDKKELKTRLILNHLIVLYNVFSPPQACTRMLAYKLYDHLTYLKPFLIILGYWPDRIDGIGQKGETIIGTDVAMDQFIIDSLRAERNTNGNV